MSLTQKLRELISKHMSVPGDVAETRPEADFVNSGLRAATGANITARRKILTDVSDILSCKAEDLEFLFDEIPAALRKSKQYDLFSEMPKPVQHAANYDIEVPDFRASLYAVAE